MCVSIWPEDATCGARGTHSRPCFKSTVKGPESRERFLLLPKVVADVWYVGKMGQTCACCYAVPLTAVYGRGHAAQGSSSLQSWQSGGCRCSGAWLCAGALSNSVLTHSFLAAKKSLLLHVACLGDLLLSLSLENAVRGTAPPSMFSTWQKDRMRK